MYAPAIIEKRLNRMADAIRRSADPDFSFTEFSLSEIDERQAELDQIWDPEAGKLLRPLSPEQEIFIRHEINRCKVDFGYWLRRHCRIKSKDAELVRIVPTSVQELFLAKAAQAELEALSGQTGDGLLFAVLKARQLGISTIADCIIAHRCFFYGNIAAIVASDVDDHTANLFEILVRILDSLPWWMRPRSTDPTRDYRAKNKVLSFYDQDSIIRFGSGKNMQGGQGQEKGSIGTGQTLHLFHISEFALWLNAEQIYDSLLPAVPHSPRAFGIIESTAKGRGNEWHLTWERAKSGMGRLRPVFFPWYTDPRDYRLPAPAGWSPLDYTRQHADRVYDTSSRWVGKSVTLTREQMYWYEKTYAEYPRLPHAL